MAPLRLLLSFNSSKVQLERRAPAIIGAVLLSFNSSKVQLEHDNDENLQILQGAFNSSKVQLELACVVYEACKVALSIPVRYN